MDPQDSFHMSTKGKSIADIHQLTFNRTESTIFLFIIQTLYFVLKEQTESHTNPLHELQAAKITNWWISTCEVTVSDPTVRWKINKSSVWLLSTHTLKTPTVLLIVRNCLEPNKPWTRLIKSTLETSVCLRWIFTGLGAWKRDNFTCENFS